MKHFSISRTAIAAAILAVITACSGRNEWTVNGKIEGAEGQTILLEASDNGRWFVIDSIEVNSSGQFSANHSASGYPDIYRLRLGDKTLYFPIDSIETVTVVTKADAFDDEYEISGSSSADMLMAVDRKVKEASKDNATASIGADSVLKRELSTILLDNPSGIISYYIINKRVHGVPLFNPGNKADLRVIGAVANAFNQYRPNDPRTTYLTRLFISNKAKQTGITDTIAAPEIRIIDINLYDNKGTRHSLEETAEKADVVILNFTAYTGEFSQPLNVALNKLYERYHDKGLEIYQVSVDNDEYQWRQSAKNLPWITVFNPVTESKTLLEYNVGAVPAIFIISNGEIVERIDNISKLEAAVAKRM